MNTLFQVLRGGRGPRKKECFLGYDHSFYGIQFVTIVAQSRMSTFFTKYMRVRYSIITFVVLFREPCKYYLAIFSCQGVLPPAPPAPFAGRKYNTLTPEISPTRVKRGLGVGQEGLYMTLTGQKLG